MICQAGRPPMSSHTNDDRAVSRFPVPDLEHLPDDIRDMVMTVQEKIGFIPNVFLAYAHRPDECRAFFAMHDALMLREGNLSKSEKEMIVVAISGGNSCLYCVVAHGAILRILSKQPLLSDQVATNYRKADITPRHQAMLDFATKVNKQSDQICQQDFDGLHDHGFTDEDVWDIAGITAFFGLSNRMANLMSMRPNDEFYSMGR
jgi:uncharacterized peroxidase-related enzyme